MAGGVRFEWRCGLCPVWGYIGGPVTPTPQIVDERHAQWLRINEAHYAAKHKTKESK